MRKSIHKEGEQFYALRDINGPVTGGLPNKWAAVAAKVTKRFRRRILSECIPNFSSRKNAHVVAFILRVGSKVNKANNVNWYTVLLNLES